MARKSSSLRWAMGQSSAASAKRKSSAAAASSSKRVVAAAPRVLKLAAELFGRFSRGQKRLRVAKRKRKVGFNAEASPLDSCCVLSARRHKWVVRGLCRAFLYLSGCSASGSLETAESECSVFSPE